MRNFYAGKNKKDSKGKFDGKGKKGASLEAQAQWMKGKGKSYGVAPRTVNAYSAELCLHGLEISPALGLAASTTSPSKPELGILDCGATASAAPEAVLQGLILPFWSKTAPPRLKWAQLHARTSGLGMVAGVEHYIEQSLVQMCQGCVESSHCTPCRILLITTSPTLTRIIWSPA